MLNSWELYLILLVATLLRVYAADKAPFDEDQAGLLRLARDAFAHGLWPASSNISSQTILHGPIITYFLMLTAFFTDNPLGGTLTTAFFNVIGILVTYLFVRRYYGRLAGGLAAALYAITTGTLVYNRFIWQPNLVPPMIILLMFALFWGGVERRKGWLIPAVALLGILYETHESGLVMALPFVVALLLATPKTIRWQDVVLAGLALCLIFLPYLEWLRVSHFVDLSVLQSVASYPPQIDTQIYNTYTAFMSPYIQSPSNLIDVLPDHPQSLLSGPVVLMLPIRYLLQVIHVTSPILALGGGLVLLLLLFQPSPAMGQLAVSTKRLRAWLIASYNDPARRGFVLLLVWQGVLTLLLMRHSIDFYGHYATFLLPGPFILVAICLTRILAYLQKNQGWWHRGARLVVYAVVGLTICANLIGSVTFVVDTERGAFNSNFSYPLYLHYTEYGEFKQAIEATDQLAQQHHISHVYLVGNPGFRESLRYFAQQMRTPTTVIGGDTHSKGTCVVLPGPGSGPVVYLVSPYTPLVNEIMQRYAHATLVQQPQRTGGDPFNLYILNARPLITPGQHVFTKTLQLLEPQAQRVNTATPWMVTHWGVTESRKAAWRTDYNYTFKATLDGQGGSLLTTECVMTAVQPGTQLFAAFKLPQQGIAPKLLNISVKQYTFQPWSIKSGPLRFEVMKQRIGVSRQLKTPGGQNTIAVSAS